MFKKNIQEIRTKTQQLHWHFKCPFHVAWRSFRNFKRSLNGSRSNGIQWLCRQVHFGLCTMTVCSADISIQVLAISWTPSNDVRENKSTVLVQLSSWLWTKRKPTSYDASFIDKYSWYIDRLFAFCTLFESMGYVFFTQNLWTVRLFPASPTRDGLLLE